MAGILTVINSIILVITSLFFILLGISSFNEKEYRACGISLGFLILNTLVWIFFLYAPDGPLLVNIIIISFLCFFGFLSLIRFFPTTSPDRDIRHITQYDERDT
ncbi:MAG: hypothetical protein WC836_18815, partial [Desulfobacula sp.]